MDIDQAANFLAGSVLIGIGFIVICTVIIVINNLFSKYWKPIEWSFPEYRFIEPGSKQESK
jgi:hypothetical protein